MGKCILPDGSVFIWSSDKEALTLIEEKLGKDFRVQVEKRMFSVEALNEISEIIKKLEKNSRDLKRIFERLSKASVQDLKKMVAEFRKVDKL